jgi:twitching motility protein PilT
VVDSPKRIPIAEVMLFNATIRKLLLQGEDERLESAIQLGRPEGMQTFEDSLFEFVEMQFLDRTTALAAAPNPEAFKMRLKGINVKSSGLL